MSLLNFKYLMKYFDIDIYFYLNNVIILRNIIYFLFLSWFCVDYFFIEVYLVILKIINGRFNVSLVYKLIILIYI